MRGKSPYRELKKKTKQKKKWRKKRKENLPSSPQSAFLSNGVPPQVGMGHIIVFAGCRPGEEGFQTFLCYRFAGIL